jgi:hypothetical protein
MTIEDEVLFYISVRIGTIFVLGEGTWRGFSLRAPADFWEVIWL